MAGNSIERRTPGLTAGGPFICADSGVVPEAVRAGQMAARTGRDSERNDERG